VASRTGERTLRLAGGWARIGPWHDHADVAHLVLATETVLPPQSVQDCAARVRAAGFTAAVTSPLTMAAAAPFLEAGFVAREHLHLLVHRLERAPTAPTARLTLRRGWRGDRATVTALDDRAFSPAWRLGNTGLQEALTATPSVRFRIGHRSGDPSPVAYAVTGRAGTHGYLQRLAVDPTARGEGFARALIHDALRWLRRHTARRCSVNTQADNHAALHLYLACGFERQPHGLAVLGAQL
jgi:ribosomal protein S18 acetylase RimI-like enzyme